MAHKKSDKIGKTFNRCVKAVRKTVKARKGSTKESAAIAICTKSVLQTRGKTMKRYRKSRLTTQRKLRGGQQQPPIQLQDFLVDIPEKGIMVIVNALKAASKDKKKSDTTAVSIPNSEQIGNAVEYLKLLLEWQKTNKDKSGLSRIISVGNASTEDTITMLDTLNKNKRVITTAGQAALFATKLENAMDTLNMIEAMAEGPEAVKEYQQFKKDREAAAKAVQQPPAPASMSTGRKVWELGSLLT